MSKIVSEAGTVGRTQSSRRFILCIDTGERIVTLRRSDNLDVVRTIDRRRGGDGTRRFIWDRVEGRVVV